MVNDPTLPSSRPTSPTITAKSPNRPLSPSPSPSTVIVPSVLSSHHPNTSPPATPRSSLSRQPSFARRLLRFGSGSFPNISSGSGSAGGSGLGSSLSSRGDTVGSGSVQGQEGVQGIGEPIGSGPGAGIGPRARSVSSDFCSVDHGSEVSTNTQSLQQQQQSSTQQTASPQSSIPPAFPPPSPGPSGPGPSHSTQSMSSGSTPPSSVSNMASITTQPPIPAPTRTSTGGGGAGNGNGSGTGTTPPSSHMESAVTRLLVQTRRLLESLTKWSHGQETETGVSDIYVKLGNEFNVAVAAFAKEGVSMTDLMSIPGDLRTCLETALSEEACQETLDTHLPEIRKIIINLLSGLKEKQALYRQMSAERRELEQRRQTQGPAGVDGSGSGSGSGSLRRGMGSYSGGRSQGIPMGPRAPTPTHVRSGSNAARSSGDDLRRYATEGNLSRNTSAASSGATGGGGGGRSSSPSFGRPSSDGGSSTGTVDGRESFPGGFAVNAASVQPGPIRGGLPDGPRPKKDSIGRKNSLEGGALRDSRDGSGSGSGSESGPGPSLGRSKSSTSLRHSQSTGKLFSQEISRTESPPLPPLPTGPMPARSSTATTASLSLSQPSVPPRLPAPETQGDLSLHSMILNSSGSRSTAAENDSPILQSSSGLPGIILTDDPSDRDSTSSSQPGFLSGSENQPSSQALDQLRKSDALVRRASKRFSAYTFNKMAGVGSGVGSPNLNTLPSLGIGMGLGGGVGVGGGELVGGRRGAKDSKGPEDGAGREFVNGVRRARGVDGSIRRSQLLAGTEGVPVPPLPTNLEKQAEVFTSSGSRSGELSDTTVDPATTSEEGISKSTLSTTTAASEPASHATASSTLSAEPNFPDRPEQMTIYLQLGRDVKKARIEGTPSISSLRVLFTERFQYNPGMEDFPSIYLRDPESGVQYELEDMGEVKDKSVLSLNIEPLDQVKQHIDVGLASLSTDIKALKAALAESVSAAAAAAARLPSTVSMPTDLSASAPRPSEQQFQAAAMKVLKMNKEAKAASSPAASPRSDLQEPPQSARSERSSRLTAEETPASHSPNPSISSMSEARAVRLVTDLKSHYDEVQNLRRDVSVLRQVYADFSSDTMTLFQKLRGQTERVRQLANMKVGGSRAFIDQGKNKLDSRSQELLTKIDELQDTIDDLKNDVTNRKMRPKTSILSGIKSNIASTATELADITKYISTVKPMWKKTWEEELQNIVEEQQLLHHQEELLSDLKEDHKNVTEVFGQIEQYLNLRQATSGRVRDFAPPPPRDDHEGLKTVMMEVQALTPDPMKRLRAIEQAEKNRVKELGNRQDEFASELSGFVEGKMLKKSGGVEEAERLRQMRSEASLKAMFGSPAAPTVDKLASTAPAGTAAAAAASQDTSGGQSPNDQAQQRTLHRTKSDDASEDDYRSADERSGGEGGLSPTDTKREDY